MLFRAAAPKWAGGGRVEPRLRLRSPWKPLCSGLQNRVLRSSRLWLEQLVSGRSAGRGAGLHVLPGPTRVNALTSRRTRSPEAPLVHPPPRPQGLGFAPRGWASGFLSEARGPAACATLVPSSRSPARPCCVMDLNLNRADYLQVNPRGQGGRRGGEPGSPRGFHPPTDACRGRRERGRGAALPSPSSRAPPARPRRCTPPGCWRLRVLKMLRESRRGPWLLPGAHLSPPQLPRASNPWVFIPTQSLLRAPDTTSQIIIKAATTVYWASRLFSELNIHKCLMLIKILKVGNIIESIQELWKGKLLYSE